MRVNLTKRELLKLLLSAAELGARHQREEQEAIAKGHKPSPMSRLKRRQRHEVRWLLEQAMNPETAH